MRPLEPVRSLDSRNLAHLRRIGPSKPSAREHEPDGYAVRLIVERSAGRLAFERNAQPTLTASAAQVRQPIYRSSLGLWRRYANELAPLRRHFDTAGVRIGDDTDPAA